MPAKKATSSSTPAKKATAAKKAPVKKATTPATAAKAAPAKKAAAKRVAPAPVPATQAQDGPPVGVELATLCCQFACEKKATNPIILDVRGISTITDYTVICTGTSLPHLRAIRKEIAARLWDDHGVKTIRMDGTPESLWMVADFSDVMVHIFHSDTRDKFGLEDLWSDAPRVPFKESKTK